MRAAQINEYGGKNVLKTVDDVPKPEVQAGQVLIEVCAAGVNPFDVKVRSGQAKQMAELNFPATLGGDFAGIVAEVAEGVSDFKVGDEVYGQAGALSGHGSFAEFTPVKSEAVGLKPESVDFERAAALPLASVSAYQALVEHAEVKDGQKVLIHGGAGGIGSFAIPLAKNLGAYVATTALAEESDFVKELGADEVIDYKSQDFAGILRDFDVVYDTVGRETFIRSYPVLKKGGVIVSMVEQPNVELDTQYGVRSISQFTRVTTDKLNKIAELVDQSVIKPKVDKIFSLDEAAEALDYLETGKHHGKVVIKIK